VPLPAVIRGEVAAKCPALLLHSLKNYHPAVLAAKLGSLMQSDVSFNIMAGTLILRWNIERVGGNLNKAIIAYNKGAYAAPLKEGGSLTAAVDTAAFIKAPGLNEENRGYLKKMLGVAGYCSLVYKDKLITI
jgi:soluble lytic murein transglycosylase-like protein